MKSTDIGSAEKSFSECKDWTGGKFDSIFQQGVVGYTVDDLVSQHNLPFPDYIKIDVDGIEKEIVFGAKKILSDKRSKSILVEVSDQNKADKDDIVGFLEELGFKIVSKAPSQVDPAKHELAQCYQYIFNK